MTRRFRANSLWFGESKGVNARLSPEPRGGERRGVGGGAPDGMIPLSHALTHSKLRRAVNFLATVLTCRLRRRAKRAGLLNKCSFKDLMEDLATAWRKVDGPLSPASDDSYWVTDYPGVFDLLERLGLSKPKPNAKAKPEVTAQGIVVHRKPGRPRTRPIIYGPPRPRGRPRKIQ